MTPNVFSPWRISVPEREHVVRTGTDQHPRSARSTPRLSRSASIDTKPPDRRNTKDAMHPPRHSRVPVDCGIRE
jgi:hypothetical protein